MSIPLISVALSVYNDELFLPAAIESVLGQTFEDFEFLIVNDGSSDRSGAIIAD
jgi:glycosyltransferase involved in cell wall biosynthesis